MSLIYFRLLSLIYFLPTNFSSNLLNDICCRIAATFCKNSIISEKCFCLHAMISTCAGVWHFGLTPAGFPQSLPGHQPPSAKTRSAHQERLRPQVLSFWASPALSPPSGRDRLQHLSGQAVMMRALGGWLISKLDRFRVSQVRYDWSLLKSFC